MTVRETTNTIIKYIKDSTVVYTTGHKNLDLDALGAMVGVSLLADHYNKDSYLIIDESTHEAGVKKALDKLEDIKIVKTSEINNVNKSDLLVIVDTNKGYLLQNEKLLELFDRIIIIDHHDEDENTIKSNCNLIFNNVSSTCELLTLVMKDKDLYPLDFYATVLLSGIVLDTNNFSLKTNFHTYEAAYYLTKNGADNNEVQYLLKQNMKKYIAREKMLYDIKTIASKYAISVGSRKDRYRREDLAKIADTLLQFENIEASFVIAFLNKGKIGISARSMGNVDVGEIMSSLNGGGNKTVAATMIETTKIKDVYDELTKILRNL